MSLLNGASLHIAQKIKSLTSKQEQEDLESRPLVTPTSNKTTLAEQVSVEASARMGVDVRAVVALQSVLALMVLYFVATFATDKADWFNSGPTSLIDPNDPDFVEAKGGPWIMHLFFSRDFAVMTSLQLGLAVVLSVCVLNRFQTRLCLLLLLFLMICLHEKSRYVQDCGSRLLRHMLFWACLLPGSVAPQNRSAGSKIVHGLAAFGVQFQILYMYWQAVGHRRGSKEWMGPDFSAVYYITSGPAYALAPGLFLSDHLPELCRLLTVGSMLIETFAPLAPFFIPVQSWWRAVPALALMGLHAGIALTLNLWHFSILAMVINVIYLPTPFWDALQSWDVSADVQVYSQVDKPNRRYASWPCRYLREAVAGIALAYVILHLEVFRGQYRGTPLDDHGALFTETTLDELWIMYSTVNKEGTYWDIHAREPRSTGQVDVLKWLGSGSWEASAQEQLKDSRKSSFSSLYPNMRWEYFLDQTASAAKGVQVLRMRAMTRWLCAKGRDGNGLAQGSSVHFANHLVYVNPPGSDQHFQDGGIKLNRTFACEFR